MKSLPTIEFQQIKTSHYLYFCLQTTFCVIDSLQCKELDQNRDKVQTDTLLQCLSHRRVI